MHDRQEAVAEQPVRAAASKIPRDPRRAAAAAPSGSSHTDRNTASGTLARAVGARRRSPARHHLARVDRELEGGRGTGRPWCRSSGAPAPGRRRRPRRPPRIVVPAKPWAANGSRARGEDRGAGVGRAGPTAAGTRALASSRGWTAKCSRAKASDSARSRSRSLACVAPAGVDLQHDVARRSPWSARCWRNRSAPCAPRPGTRCSSLAEPVPSVRCTCRSRVTEALRHLHDVGLRDRGVREVDGGVGVVLLGRVPAGEVHLHAALGAAASAPPRVHVLDGEGDAGGLLEGGDALDEAARRTPSATGTAGARRPRRRRPPRPSRPTARACPTGRCPRPAG